MNDGPASAIHRAASAVEFSAHLTRQTVGVYADSTAYIEGLPGWERFVELSQRMQRLGIELAQTLDAMAAQASEIADRESGEIY